MVRYFPQQYPQWGVLVDENGQIVNNLNIKCGDFKNRGFRYKHQKWPSPNRDFIPVTVEIIAHPSEWVVKSERHFIQAQGFMHQKFWSSDWVVAMNLGLIRTKQCLDPCSSQCVGSWEKFTTWFRSVCQLPCLSREWFKINKMTHCDMKVGCDTLLLVTKACMHVIIVVTNVTIESI